MEQDRPVLNSHRDGYDEGCSHHKQLNDNNDNIPYLPHELISYILQLRSRIFSSYYMTKAKERSELWTDIHQGLKGRFQY